MSKQIEYCKSNCPALLKESNSDKCEIWDIYLSKIIENGIKENDLTTSEQKIILQRCDSCLTFRTMETIFAISPNGLKHYW